MPLPRLPPEILDLILLEAFPPVKEEDTNQFHRVRGASEERALCDWGAACDRAWLPFIRSLIFLAPYVGSKSRADKLSRALRLALPGDPNSAGYLAPLVRRLNLDIRERELPGKQDRSGAYRGADGITPLQIAELAALLPDLTTVSLDASDKAGWAGDPSILDAIKKFKKLQHFEVTGTGLGWKNVLAVVAETTILETLRLKAVKPDWTFLGETARDGLIYSQKHQPSVPYAFTRTLTTLVLWECSLATTEFTDLFTSLAPAALLPASAQPVGGADAFPPPALKHLTIQNLRDSTSHPFDQSLLVSHLSPLVPHLHSLHLVLFDRPAITNNAARADLYRSGRIKEGHISLPETGHRPGNALAALLGPHATSLTLGGPFCVSAPALYGALDRAAATTTSANSTRAAAGASASISSAVSASPAAPRLRTLTLQMCADVGRPAEGLDAAGFADALDREWASRLERVDVRRMQFAQPANEERAAWGEEEGRRLKGKAEEVSRERERQGAAGLVVLVDEETPKRLAEEKEWLERRKKRKGSSGSGRGGKGGRSVEDAVQGKSAKRRKT
ncbi:hypothetical protein JCM10207_005342 [Rhodosporidiobolus poonsookiae]